MSFIVNIQSATPIITETHTIRGHLPRYFAAKANHINDEVFEVNRREYERLYGNSYVVLGHLNWTIKGQLEERKHLLYTGNPTFEGGKAPINIHGVLTQNEGTVRFISRKIPAVKNYLTNYGLFYVGD